MLNYTIRDFQGSKVLELSGGLTANTSKKFEDIIRSFVDKESIIVNIENLSLITISGLRSMVDASYVAKDFDKRLIVLWPNNELLEMAEELDVYHHLIFADSLEEAGTKIKYFT